MKNEQDAVEAGNVQRSTDETASAKPDGAPEVVASNEDGCFVAGTLVHTSTGLVPIEQVRVGDRVLSQPESQGERAYRRVIGTVVHQDHEVTLVQYFTPHLEDVGPKSLDSALSRNEYLRCAVYDLAVEDFQTYYVGVDGVSVRSANSDGKDRRGAER